MIAETFVHRSFHKAGYETVGAVAVEINRLPSGFIQNGLDRTLGQLQGEWKGKKLYVKFTFLVPYPSNSSNLRLQPTPPIASQDDAIDAILGAIFQNFLVEMIPLRYRLPEQMKQSHLSNY